MLSFITHFPSETAGWGAATVAIFKGAFFFFHSFPIPFHSFPCAS
jgi:hypothetical protein